MTINKMYGLNHGIVNLVKNEMSKSEFINERAIFDEAIKFFPNEEFNIIDICDLIYHLKT